MPSTHNLIIAAVSLSLFLPRCLGLFGQTSERSLIEFCALSPFRLLARRLAGEFASACLVSLANKKSKTFCLAFTFFDYFGCFVWPHSSDVYFRILPVRSLWACNGHCVIALPFRFASLCGRRRWTFGAIRRRGPGNDCHSLPMDSIQRIAFTCITVPGRTPASATTICPLRTDQKTTNILADR